MTRPAGMPVLGVALGLAAATTALHPRAAVVAVAFCVLLHTARYTRLALLLLVLLMVATLAGVRVDTAPPAAPRAHR